MHRILTPSKMIITAAIVLLLIGSSLGDAGGGEIVQSLRSRLSDLDLSSADLDLLANKKIVIHGMSSSNPKEMAGIGVILADAAPDAFVESYRTLSVFRDSPHVVELGLFASPPRLTDLDGLHIDPEDLAAIARAKPGDSDVKLSESEISRMQTVVAKYQSSPAQMKQQIALEYKKILAERALAYARNGDCGLGGYSDKPETVDANDSFRRLASEEAQSSDNRSRLCEIMRNPPAGPLPKGDSSFLYWAREKFGELKSVINLFHVLIHKEGARVFIASKQLYSSHYTEAAMSIAEFIPFTDSAGQVHTIILYRIRLQTDMLSGSLGFMKRRMAAPRMLGTLRDSLQRLQYKLESQAGSLPAAQAQARNW
jgi:hypothetical protein